MEITTLNSLVVTGIAVPPLLVFITEYFKPLFKDISWIKRVFPFVLGFIVAWFIIPEPSIKFILTGFLLGALATGEYKSIVKK